jgi:hypothetical protein
MTTKPGEVRRYKVEGATLINLLDNPAPFFDAETAIVVLASDFDAAMRAKDAEIAALKHDTERQLATIVDKELNRG